MNYLAIVPLLVLAGGVLLQLVLGSVLSRVAKGWLAAACTVGALAAVLGMAGTILAGQKVVFVAALWDRGLPLSYAVDGLSQLFMLMATGIGAAILVYSVRYMAHEPQGTTRFYVLMLTFIAGLVSLVSSANLLVAYLSWELIGLCSYFLVGFWYQERAAVNGARKVLIMTHLPGYAFLAAILILYARTGTFLWTDPAMASAFTGSIFFLMLLAAVAKSVQFPLHTWIPEAMNAPTPVSALLHSACYVKAGIYLIARIYSFMPALAPSAPVGASRLPVAWSTVLLAIGCLTMIVGMLFALVQTDLKRLLAYSTVSQLGYIVAALGLGSPLGVAAGLFYTLSHGLFKGTLFLCAGSVQHATGTRDMRRLGGLAARMPRTALVWLIAAAAIAGVPLTNGFIAKWLVYNAALESGQVLVAAVAWVVSVFTAVYFLKATATIFYGETPEELRAQDVKEAPFAMVLGMSLLAAACIVFGLAPQLLLAPVVAPALAGLGFVSNIGLAWPGLSITSGSLQITAGALLVCVACLVGYGLYALSRRAASGARGTRTLATDAQGGASALAYGGGMPGAAAVPYTQLSAPRVVNVFSGGEPLPAGDAVGVVDFVGVAEDAFQPLYTATDPDPVYLAAWRGVSDVAARLDRLLAPIAAHPLLAGAGLAVVLFALALVH